MNPVIIILYVVAFAAAFGMVHYAPTRPDALPLQKVRAAILGFLKRRPGASIIEICRETGIAWGTAQHHLYLLAKSGLTASVRSGRAHRFFSADVDEGRRAVLSILANDGTRSLARRILENPGWRQKDLCAALGFTRKVFRQHVNLLASAGLVAELRHPKVRLYVPLDALRGQLDGASNGATPLSTTRMDMPSQNSPQGVSGASSPADPMAPDGLAAGRR